MFVKHCLTCYSNVRVHVQVYTRSVIDPIPAPNPCVDGDVAAKAADRQKKKGKMSDEEIMDKLSKWSVLEIFLFHQHSSLKPAASFTRSNVSVSRNHREHRWPQEEIHQIRKNRPGVSTDVCSRNTWYNSFLHIFFVIERLRIIQIIIRLFEWLCENTKVWLPVYFQLSDLWSCKWV